MQILAMKRSWRFWNTNLKILNNLCSCCPTDNRLRFSDNCSLSYLTVRFKQQLPAYKFHHPTEMKDSVDEVKHLLIFDVAVGQYIELTLYPTLGLTRLLTSSYPLGWFCKLINPNRSLERRTQRYWSTNFYFSPRTFLLGIFPPYVRSQCPHCSLT